MNHISVYLIYREIDEKLRDDLLDTIVEHIESVGMFTTSSTTLTAYHSIIQKEDEEMTSKDLKSLLIFFNSLDLDLISVSLSIKEGID